MNALPPKYKASKYCFEYQKFINWKTGIRKFGKLAKHSSKNWNIRKIGSCSNEWTLRKLFFQEQFLTYYFAPFDQVGIIAVIHEAQSC